jgi:hypothetical protein
MNLKIIWAVKVASSCPIRTARHSQTRQKMFDNECMTLRDGCIILLLIVRMIIHVYNSFSSLLNATKFNISYLVLKVLRIVLSSYVHNFKW